MNSVVSLFDLATNVFVRHVNLLAAYSEAIPPILYEYLLKAAMRTERVLSIRHLFLCWPLQKLSLVDCEEFKQEYAIILVRGLQSGQCNLLREIDLTGCNIGVLGTKSMLMLVDGQPLPGVGKYCGDMTNKCRQADYSIEKDKGEPNRLSITTNCYVDQGNYDLFLDVLESGHALCKFTVSYFHAIALGQRRVEKVFEKLRDIQAKGVCGVNVEMNSLGILSKCYQYLRSFSNLHYLNLSMNRIGSFGIYCILKSISAPLTHLVLNDCGLILRTSGTDWCTAVAALPCIKTLEHLEIENASLHKFGKRIMTLLLKCSETLLFLNLKNNHLTDESVPVILQLLAEPFALETLCIGKNNFSLNTERLFRSKDKLGIIEGYSNEMGLELKSKSQLVSLP